MDNKPKKEEIEVCKQKIDVARDEISKVVVGQKEIIDSLFRALLANGHVLLEGVPGIAKTLISRTFAYINSGVFKRIQFTTDLLPTDILGITAYDKKKGFYTVKGPIFANFILADEINRAPPKVQSALLEAMQERQVTIGKETFKLEPPFFVLATENPLEQMGVFPLPEAQLDRFLFKLIIKYPTVEQEESIFNKNISTYKFEDYGLRRVFFPGELERIQEIVKRVHINKDIENYIVRIVDATRNPKKYGVEDKGQYLQWGASPRATIGLHIAAKANAILNGVNFVDPEFVKQVAPDVLRHRLLLNYEGRAKKISSDDIVREILKTIKVP